MIALASGRFFARSLKCAGYEGEKHASPNSGYPEAAMAGALGVSLCGERSYDGEIYHAPIIGEEYSKKCISIVHLLQAMRVYKVSCFLLFIAILILPHA